MPDAIVLLSGGLDSATCAALARHDGFRTRCLTFAYGQRHAIEVAAAQRVAQQLGLGEPVVQTIDLRAFGGSALTADLAVPKSPRANRPATSKIRRGGADLRRGERGSAAAIGDGIPVTYVPARNTIFLAHALAYAEVIGSQDIFIGVNAVDFSGYPDCRPVFIERFEALAAVATKAAVEGRPTRLHAPLLHMAKAGIIRTGTQLGVDYSLTLSCYDPTQDSSACGTCESCLIRRKGFIEAGVRDPTRYAGA